MDISRVVGRAERLTKAARAHRADSQDFCRIAAALRHRVATEVRRHPFLRATRLARGGSDGAPATTQAKETTERRCPYCRGDSIRSLGRVQIEAGLVRSAYCCASCDRAFVFVRRALS